MTLTSDWNTRETKTLLDVKYVLNMMVRREDDRLGDEAVLVTLDCTHHRSLCRCGLVVVNDTNTAKELRDTAVKVGVRTCL